MISRSDALGLALGLVLGGPPALGATGLDDRIPSKQATGTPSVDLGLPLLPPTESLTVPKAPVVSNPLWAIPLSSLSATRDRPIFSPSRRPPASPVIAEPDVPPPKPTPPPEPDHPLLSLVGTIVSESGGFGVFVDQVTTNLVRLRTGQGHAGWVLRSVRGREAIFERDQQTFTLALPPPSMVEPNASTMEPSSR
jgi:hypothetical protein